jgi:hypothetical protein
MRRWLVPTLLLFACVVTGCSYDQVEPGLFGRSITRETTAPPIRPVTPEETLPTPNPDLPVVGEAIWTSADGLDITMRLAVHAVRRVEGVTVLDWSVTPLHGAGLRPKDPLPTTANLGLSRPGEGYPDILLVDAARARVYRPLTRKDGVLSASALRSRSRNETCALTTPPVSVASTAGDHKTCGPWCLGMPVH